MSSIAQKPHSTTDGTKLSDEALLAGLRKLGYERFRPGQLEAVRSLLDVGRLLLVAPTGGGKSLIYQLPGSLLAGTTVVISPLISLMQDQVTALNERGIAASYLASTLEPSELRRRMGEAGRGAYKLIYAAPERLTFPGFRSLLADLDCPLVAVDEAHCISQWGHDFRPEYLQIGEMLKDLPRARALACTATATPVVRDEILERLGLDADTPQILRGFARPNLALRAREVRSKRERERNVDAVLEETLGAPGGRRGAAIVYAPTRKSSEEEARRLVSAGWRAEAYHAGLPGAARDAVQSAFAAGKTEVVTATNAFGMGIDRADVRAVIHLCPPGSIEAYYQEVGRAGRDGADAVGLLLVNPGDMPLRRHLIESDVEGRSVDLETVRHKWNVFLELMRWAEGGSCRHDAILRYFGDEEETLEGCGRCDVCRDLDDNERADPEHVTEVVRKALSAVARIHGRFGIAAAAKLLRGEPDPRLVNSGLDRTRTFGILAERSEDWLLRLLRRCVTAGWVDFSGGDRPVVVLTEDGTAVMRGTRPARLLLPSDRRAPLHAGAGDPRTRRSADSVPSDELDAAAAGVFEALRGYRREVAHREGVPPYVVASDRSLRDLARLRPRSPAELQFAHGIGPAKAEKYGAELLAVIRRAEPTDAPPAVPPSNPEVQ
ncbi:MAG: ATP-dependent DNA helicase RecQ [Deltaproteobacteria bacterium]|nr:ATP-dependent DNA helicase RecQ [Deltaproteobacteria bacterium]MBW2665331.1 ATP-dependent DNA helicase RecQ [Deltaproteobacteria bacterium]